eukprot:193996_1
MHSNMNSATPTPPTESSHTAEESNHVGTAFEISSEIQKKTENKDSGSNPEVKILGFAKLIVRCPCLLCIAILVILFAITYIDGLFFVYTTDANRMYLVESNGWVQKQDAFILAQEFVAVSSADNESAIPQTQMEGFWTYQLMFKLHSIEDDDEWILTPENIEKIIEYENKIYLSTEWQKK